MVSWGFVIWSGGGCKVGGGWCGAFFDSGRPTLLSIFHQELYSADILLGIPIDDCSVENSTICGQW